MDMVSPDHETDHDHCPQIDFCRAGFRKKNVRNPLQFALSVYFTIWMIYPILWLLLEGLPYMSCLYVLLICRMIYPILWLLLEGLPYPECCACTRKHLMKANP
jgi:hypothetical protein